MLLALFGFLRLSLADILDILLLATLIFIVFRWIRGSSAISIFIAIISLFIIRVLVSAFNMRLMTAIMDMVLDVGVLALIVIFQPEIRRFLIRLGNRYMESTRGRAIADKLFGKKAKSMGTEAVNEVTEACRRMSEDKTGALIVIEQNVNLRDYERTGIDVDGIVSSQLLINIFEHHHI